MRNYENSIEVERRAERKKKKEKNAKLTLNTQTNLLLQNFFAIKAQSYHHHCSYTCYTSLSLSLQVDVCELLANAHTKFRHFLTSNNFTVKLLGNRMSDKSLH